MINPRFYSAIRSGVVAAASVAALAALAGCEERPYPAPSHTPPPTAEPSADLMGAPASAPPPAAGAPAYAPPPYAPTPPPSGYDTGAVVAMAPIPNPGEGPSEYYDGPPHHRLHARYSETGSEAETAARSPYGEGRSAGVRRSQALASQAEPAQGFVPPRPPMTAQAAPAPAPTGKSHKHKGGAPAAVASAAAVGAVHSKHAAASTNAAAPTGDRTANLAALQTALTDAIGKTAMLAAPARFTPNQPTDVSLTVPASFADTLRNEAQKDALSDAAASANMTAVLAGDGFAVLPADTQSTPLASGQPTEFHWTVTAQPGAKGPLHADVGANLLGAGSDALVLGSVQKASGRSATLAPRIIGASLLVLIAALVVGWLARARRPVAARGATGRVTREGRPLDMGSGDGGAP